MVFNVRNLLPHPLQLKSRETLINGCHMKLFLDKPLPDGASSRTLPLLMLHNLDLTSAASGPFVFHVQQSLDLRITAQFRRHTGFPMIRVSFC